MTEPESPLMEVRCCCDAHLIGWLPRPAKGTLCVRYALPPSRSLDRPVEPCRVTTEYLTFDLALVTLPDIQLKLALKSRDYPIEKLRRIPDFIEATNEISSP